MTDFKKAFIKRNTPISAGQLHYYHTEFYYSMPDLHKCKVESNNSSKMHQQITEYHFEENRKMHGVKRVIAFCIMIVLLPATLIIMPLHLRKTVFADVIYQVAESDIIEIRDGISSIFCSRHTLRMSSSFNAFQLRNKPEISKSRKHIRLRKSMTLPDDTLEYWGFFLLKGATISVRFCSRYEGSRILLVQGTRELRLCGLTDHNKNKMGANYAHGHEQVKVFYEDVAEITEEKTPSDGLLEHENHGGEDLSEDQTTVSANLTSSTTAAPPKRYRKKLKKGSLHRNKSTELPNQDPNEPNATAARQRRHAERKQKIFEQLYKREKRENVYDRKYSHGGNAMNFTETDESNSISSFETGLFSCFNGAILLAEGFPPRDACNHTQFLETGKHRVAQYEVVDDGYYYYIFYSDNDLVRNDIHALFDIYKPTFQYSNLSESSGCLNSTYCSFNISFLSDEIVVVEVPTRDGIEHEEDDITNLISTCHPRSEIYALFPLAVLVLILCCAFL
ncbi:CG31886 [Drosophila busckii]|uniref:CG31886 n=1 Tax=Drosophila busckii TaxID=30019 RepID=A0A0M4EDR5_DROBS|nr:CG31886 [Drosophila busckii]